jgi:hypothetical protein
VIRGAAATRHPWRGAAKPASLPVYPPNHYRIPASVVNGAPEIKIKIKIYSKSESKSGSLRIVVSVVDTYAPTAVFQSAWL